MVHWTASGGSFFISKSALALRGVPLCVWEHAREERSGRHRDVHRARGPWEGGAASRGALWSISCVFHWRYSDNTKLGLSLTAQLSNQVTSSWQTQTRAPRDVNTQRQAHTCVDTQYMQPAAVANDVSPDLAKLAFCFTAWTQSRGAGFIWQWSTGLSVGMSVWIKA